MPFSKAYAQADDYITYIADPKKQDLRMYWRGANGKPLQNFSHLKTMLKSQGKDLVFAMNGGMYDEWSKPIGLYVEEFKVLRKINKASGKGNFYTKPNGVFYITADRKAYVWRTRDYSHNSRVRFATQSGPMLVINGTVNPAFSKRSTSKNLRNGVGILPGGRVVFAMSKMSVTLYDFASYFKSLGCQQALYLDGYVSMTYLPSQLITPWYGDFGVMIAEVRAAR